MHRTQVPDKLAALATIVASVNTKAGARSRSLGGVNRRNAAIMAALNDGHSPGLVGQAANLTERTIQEIAGDWRKGASSKRGKKVTAKIAPLRGPVDFDQASPMALAVLGAGQDTCRWPMGDGEDFRFCGARAVASKSGGLTLRSFCAEHAAVAYRGQTRIVAEAA